MGEPGTQPAAEPRPDYEPPALTMHGTISDVTAAAHAGMSMDHHFPTNGRPGVSH